MTTLETHTEKLRKMCPKTVAEADQLAFMRGASELERGLKAMIDGAEMYCRAVKDQNDWILGDDYVLGPEMGSILNSLLGLLNGPGRFDSGTLDGAIRDIAKQYNIKDVEQ